MRCLSVLIVLLASACAAAQEPDVAQYLQSLSVTIKAGRSEGSGVAFSRDGTTLIWTAGHVVEGLRKTREVVEPGTGTKRTVVEFDDPQIVQQLIENGRTVGRVEMDAEVIRYSDSDSGEDVALLRVRKKGFLAVAARFHDGGEVPLGTRLFHVGSLLGQVGSNSMTDGIMSQHGRVLGKKEFDQTTVTAFPGSSGGGVYLADGQYVGMVVRGAGEGFNLIVPVRRLRAWAKKAGVEWAVDPAVAMPTAEELEKLPVEEIGATFKLSAAGGQKDFGFLIRRTEER